MSTLAPFPTAGVTIELLARCFDCQHYHVVQTTPTRFLDALAEWELRHRGHDIDFLSTKRRIPKGFDDTPYERLGEAPWWLEWRENADIKPLYAASAAITCSLQTGPLASSSTFTSGRESLAIDNNTNRMLDERITAKITTGTTPTASTEIRVYAYAALSDTPTYPDTITGTDANVSLTNSQILDSGFVALGVTAVSGTSNVGYPIRCLTLARAFGHMPKRYGLYITHNTAVALNATAGNHVLTRIGAYLQSV